MDGVDLCVWCLWPAVEPGMTVSGGGCEVLFADEGWTCSCGASYRPPDAPRHVLDVVPCLPAATASAHVSGPHGRGLTIGGWNARGRPGGNGRLLPMEGIQDAP